MRKIKRLFGGLCVIVLATQIARGMPMRPMPVVTVTGTVVEAKWVPEETSKGQPGAPGSLGRDRKIPAHFEVQLKDVDVQIVHSTGNKDFDGPSGRQPKYDLRINSDKKDLLKPGMKIKVPNYRIGGDEGGVWSQHDEVQVLTAPTNDQEAAGRAADVIVVNKMEITLSHPALFYADEGLGFTLKLKNVSGSDQFFAFMQGISGTTIGTMAWTIKDVKNGTVWEVGRDPNPGPAPGAPVSMGIKTLKPGESFDAPVRVLGWGKTFCQGGTESKPKQTASKLPAGKYVASLSVEVKANDITIGSDVHKGGWEGSFKVKSGEFEVSAKCRPIPEKVRKTREQIVALARERMVSYWKRLKDAGYAECKALELSDLQAAELKVEESVGQGLEQGQTIYDITFLAPCKKLGGKVKFQWSFNEFGDERSMTGVQLIKEVDDR